MKVNWFCPLPPARSGIAVDFFRTILPALSSRAAVTLWTDQTEWSANLANYAPVRTFRLTNMPWAELNQADITFFNLGNNHLFHGVIWEVSRLLPGITILHDLRLDDFFENWCPGLFPAAASLDQSLDNLQVALENSLGVVVHTEDAYEQLNAFNRWIVAHVPLPFALPSPVNVLRIHPSKPTAAGPARSIGNSPGQRQVSVGDLWRTVASRLRQRDD
jgi:hypothetical protein